MIYEISKTVNGETFTESIDENDLKIEPEDFKNIEAYVGLDDPLDVVLHVIHAQFARPDLFTVDDVRTVIQMISYGKFELELID